MLVRLCVVIAVSYLQHCNQRCGYSRHGYSKVTAATCVEQLVYAYTRMHILLCTVQLLTQLLQSLQVSVAFTACSWLVL
jgi:hypothetical protein